MPFDTWGSHLENDIADLENYIQWVGNSLNNQAIFGTEYEKKANEIGQQLLKELQRNKESKEQQLRLHRQRDKESGVKQ